MRVAQCFGDLGIRVLGVEDVVVEVAADLDLVSDACETWASASAGSWASETV